MTFAGRSRLAATRSSGANCCVRKKGPFRLTLNALSQPFSGKSSNGATQPVPALFTRMSSPVSRSRTASTRARTPSSVDMSFGIAMQSPSSASSAAVRMQTSAWRAVMYVRTPRRTSSSAIIRPMPLLPPVTTATRPSRSNMSLIR